VLLGFMGTGKTTIAKRLAEKTGSQYVSTDDLIEAKEKVPISKIFEEKGEVYFREVEKSVIKDVSQLDNRIIDAGGGVVLDAENVLNLKRNGILICFWAEPKDIYNRIKKYTHRPLLQVEKPQEKISELLEKRRPFYERADFHINTSSLGAEESVEAVMKYVQQY